MYEEEGDTFSGGRIKMERTLVVLVLVALSSVSGRFRLFKKFEKTEVIEVREFDRRDDLPEALRNFGDTRGKLVPCGNLTTKFDVEWSPEVLSTQGVATFYWDVVAPVELDSGKIHVDVYLPSIPQSPIFSLDQDGTCETIKKTFPTLTCPIKPNVELKGQMTAGDLTRMPAGKYKIVVKVTNSKNQEFLCGQANIEFTS